MMIERRRREPFSARTRGKPRRRRAIVHHQASTRGPGRRGLNRGRLISTDTSHALLPSRLRRETERDVKIPAQPPVRSRVSLSRERPLVHFTVPRPVADAKISLGRSLLRNLFDLLIFDLLIKEIIQKLFVDLHIQQQLCFFLPLLLLHLWLMSAVLTSRGTITVTSSAFTAPEEGSFRGNDLTAHFRQP